jgi:hypothetical protein
MIHRRQASAAVTALCWLPSWLHLWPPSQPDLRPSLWPLAGRRCGVVSGRRRGHLQPLVWPVVVALPPATSVAITGRRRGLFGHRPGRISSQLVEFLSSVVVEAPPPRPLTLAWSSQLCTRW